ncbi:pentapeptide repeat-containing protein [Vreelandella maris]|uniref:Pentapeptide repeat-containing protein n=1 Tax=Vreelandella maris TaxID=2729617 RepID=A0A7Y6RAJ2_9GAMM|nr:pentapeptide repeat-containing protein [Halomonas maris]NVF13356.1 pentapeptide repeat-containing protein [Halomonas maris]|tara:strand:+ start:1585 stop:3297 length:1713 start_codon:yes stop_codon:yes gene_type:complete
MSDALKNPDMPPGALVETFDDGSALRNDGVKLTPANQNPWYVLATVTGEHSAKNRRFWNGWMCQNMSADERKALALQMSMPEEELAPLSDEEMQQIRARFKTNFPKKAIHETLPNPDHAADLQLVNLTHDISFEQFYFSSPALFEHVHFAGFADFDKAHFSYSANFQETHFSEGAFFPDANFAGRANFIKVYFGELAEFKEAHFVGHALFQESHFVGTADFTGASFVRPIDFQETLFKGGAGFERVHFGEVANFQDSHFAGETNFQSTHFAKDADFDKVLFSAHTSFLKSHFAGNALFLKTHFTDGAGFQEVHFAEHAMFPDTHFTGDVFFPEAHFTRDAFFERADFTGLADFSDGAFKAFTSFDGATFKTQVPKYYQREMHQDTTFSDTPKHWPKITSDSAKAGKQAYTRLRQIAADNHNPDLEHFFLRQEMRCKETLAQGLDKWVFKGYRWLAGSGISVLRPAVGLVLIWLISGFAYLFRYLYLQRNAEKIIAANSELPALADMSVLGSFGLSFANLFAFLGLNRLYFQEVIAELGPWLSLLAGMQTVSGVVLLFFLGLGLRNRFRLK